MDVGVGVGDCPLFTITHPHPQAISSSSLRTKNTENASIQWLEMRKKEFESHTYLEITKERDATMLSLNRFILLSNVTPHCDLTIEKKDDENRRELLVIIYNDMCKKRVKFG